MFRRSRRHTKWNKRQTNLVVGYFAQWIETGQPGLPGKKDILNFLNRHGDIVNFEWTVIRNKVLNEKMAFAKRKKSMLEHLCNEGPT